jgi:NAD dependent epimerase/dehydratase family enzyme
MGKYTSRDLVEFAEFVMKQRQSGVVNQTNAQNVTHADFENAYAAGIIEMETSEDTPNTDPDEQS